MQKESQSLVYSNSAHRTAIGVLGIALPVVLMLGAWLVNNCGLQRSISHYYYTGMRDILVGALWAIGFSLLSYKGYERADDITSDLACFFAVGITLFPTTPEKNASAQAEWIGNIHLSFAALFFLMLIYFSLFLFTKTDPQKTPTSRKLLRNKIYRGCGYIMAICILLIAIYSALPDTATAAFEKVNPTFWLESVAIWTFGISWLTKGEAILKDKTNA